MYFKPWNLLQAQYPAKGGLLGDPKNAGDGFRVIVGYYRAIGFRVSGFDYRV